MTSRQIGVVGHEECRQPGDHRSGHAGAVVAPVLVARRSGVDGLSRSEDVDGLVAVVAEGSRQLIAALPRRGANLDPERGLASVLVAGRGEVVGGVDIGAVIAGRVHHEHSERVRISHGCVDDLLVRGVPLAEAHVDDVGPVIHRVADGICDVFVALIAVGHGPNRHDAHPLCHALHAKVVVPCGAHDSGDVCAVRGVGARHVVVAVDSLGLVAVVVSDNGARVKVGVVVVLDLALQVVVVVEHVGGGEVLPVEIHQDVPCTLHVGRRGGDRLDRVAREAVGVEVRLEGLRSELNGVVGLLDVLELLLCLLPLLPKFAFDLLESLIGVSVVGRHGGGVHVGEAVPKVDIEPRELVGIGAHVLPVWPPDKVPAVDVVHVPVVVVVLVVARDLVGVGPALGPKVLVVDIDARVDDGDGDGVAGRPILKDRLVGRFGAEPRQVAVRAAAVEPILGGGAEVRGGSRVGGGSGGGRRRLALRSGLGGVDGRSTSRIGGGLLG